VKIEGKLYNTTNTPDVKANNKRHQPGFDRRYKLNNGRSFSTTLNFELYMSHTQKECNRGDQNMGEVL